VRAVLTVWGTT